MMTTTVGHSYLISRNYILNGGIFAEFISNIKLINTNISTATVQIGSVDVGQYVKNYLLNSTKSSPIFDLNSNLITNYENVNNSNLLTSSFALMFIIVPILFCFLFCFFWMLWKIVKPNPTFQSYFSKNDQFCPWRTNPFRADDSDSVAVFSKKEIQIRRKYFLDKSLIFSSICGLLTVAYIISFTISVSSQISLLKKLQSSTDNNSLLSSWKQASQNIDSFFSFILTDSQQMFNQSLNHISTSIQDLLTNSLNQLTKSILTTFGVTAMFSTISDLLSNLNVTVNSMAVIVGNSKATLGDIDVLLGKIQVNSETIQYYMPLVCKQLVDPSQCQKYLNDLSGLKVPIITSNINTDSSVNMQFVIKQFSLNLTQLTTQVQNLQVSFDQTLQALTAEKVKEMNVVKSIDSIGSYWKYVSDFVLPLKVNFQATSDSLSVSILEIITILNAVCFIVLIFIFLTIFYFIFSISRYFAMYYYMRVFLVDEMHVSSTQPVFMFYQLEIFRRIKRLKDLNSPNWIIYTYFIIFSWILIILIIICVLFVSAGEILYNETCVQFWNSNGLRNSDKILDSFLTSQCTSINVAIFAINLPVQINLTKPEKILESILNNCTNDTGLLGILKLSDAVNISTLIWNPQNLDVLKSGLNLTFNTIINLNTQNLVPSDMNTFLSSVKTVSQYFDEVNYTLTINELSKGIIPMQNLSHWLNETIAFFSLTNSPNSLLVLRSLNNIQLLVPDITNLQSLVDNLNHNYQLIQQRQTTGTLITQLLTGLDKIKTSFKSSPETYKIVSDAYSLIMLNNFTKITDIFLTNQIKVTLNKLFPCNFLSKTLTLVLNNFCSDNQILEIFVSHGIILAILGGILILIFHFHWTLIRLDFNENSEKNISTC